MKFKTAVMLFAWSVSAITAVAASMESDPAVPEKILWEPGKENAYPRWSKDGEQILYQTNRTGKWQIHIMNRDGTGDRPVMADDFNNNFVDWSPDNSQIAFVSDRDGNEEIYTIAVDGTGLKRLTQHVARDIHPYFSPDGKSLLFNSNRDDHMSFEVYRINADGTGEERLTYSDEVETCARFSPDMSQIVMLRGEANDEVYVCDAGFTQWTNVTNTPSAEGWPAWSHDGKHIIYSCDESGTFSLYLMDSNGANRTRLTYPLSNERDARAQISPDGSTVVFNRQIGRTIGVFLLQLK